MKVTEKEKMLAGEVYNCLDAALEAERLLVKAQLRAFNSAAEAAEQQAILQTILGRMGQHVVVEPPFYCSYGRHIFIGDHSYLNFGCTILDNNEVWIGRHVMIGPSVQIYTAMHALSTTARNKGLEMAKKIVIKDNVWIGGGAIILPGVVIEENAVIGAGAVVTRNVAAHTVVAGNPARVIRNLSGEFSI